MAGKKPADKSYGTPFWESSFGQDSDFFVGHAHVYGGQDAGPALNENPVQFHDWVWYTTDATSYAALTEGNTIFRARQSDNTVVVSNLAVKGNAVFTNSLTVDGTITGNGSGLTSIPAANLTGSIPTNSLTSVPAGNLNGIINQANVGASGSYTPTIGDGVNNFSGGNNGGYYLKMGNLVYFEVNVSWSGKGSANSGSVAQISLPPGMPVASQNTVPNFTIGIVQGIAFGNLLTAVSPSGAPYFELLSSYSGASPQTLTVSTLSTSGELSVSGFYRWQ